MRLEKLIELMNIMLTDCNKFTAFKKLISELDAKITTVEFFNKILPMFSDSSCKLEITSFALMHSMLDYPCLDLSVKQSIKWPMIVEWLMMHFPAAQDRDKVLTLLQSCQAFDMTIHGEHDLKYIAELTNATPTIPVSTSTPTSSVESKAVTTLTLTSSSSPLPQSPTKESKVSNSDDKKRSIKRPAIDDDLNLNGDSNKRGRIEEEIKKPRYGLKYGLPLGYCDMNPYYMGENDFNYQVKLIKVGDFPNIPLSCYVGKQQDVKSSPCNLKFNKDWQTCIEITNGKRGRRVVETYFIRVNGLQLATGLPAVGFVLSEVYYCQLANSKYQNKLVVQIKDIGEGRAWLDVEF